MMIDSFCKFYLQNNDVTYAYYINLVKAIIRHQKLLLICRELSTVAFIPCKNQRELLTSWVVFTVNSYKIFHGKWKHGKDICGCKPSKETTLSLIKISLVLIKNVKALDYLQNTQSITK